MRRRAWRNRDVAARAVDRVVVNVRRGNGLRARGIERGAKLMRSRIAVGKGVINRQTRRAVSAGEVDGRHEVHIDVIKLVERGNSEVERDPRSRSGWSYHREMRRGSRSYAYVSIATNTACYRVGSRDRLGAGSDKSHTAWERLRARIGQREGVIRRHGGARAAISLSEMDRASIVGVDVTVRVERGHSDGKGRARSRTCRRTHRVMRGRSRRIS